jgi:hypothetical protein
VQAFLEQAFGVRHARATRDTAGEGH